MAGDTAAGLRGIMEVEVENEEEKSSTSVTPCTSFVRKNLMSKFENTGDSGIFSNTPGSREQSYKYNFDHSFGMGQENSYKTPSNEAAELTPVITSTSINFNSYSECNSEEDISVRYNYEGEYMDVYSSPEDKFDEIQSMELINQSHEKSVYMDCEELSNCDSLNDLPSASIQIDNLRKIINDPFRQKRSISSDDSPIESPRSSIQIGQKKLISPKRRKQSRSKLLFERRSLYGFENIDILYFLSHKENVPHILSRILSYLSVEDLVNVCSVSKTWEKICNNDLQARKRLQEHKKICNATKENLNMGSKEVRMKNGSRLMFSNIQNLCESKPVKASSPATSPRTKRFQLFWKEGEKLDRKSKLIMCPQCRGPVRCHIAGNNLGQCDKCHYKFCTICLNSFHYSTRCHRISSVPSTFPVSRIRKDMIIGSKESKRRLSRT